MKPELLDWWRSERLAWQREAGGKSDFGGWEEEQALAVRQQWGPAHADDGQNVPAAPAGEPTPLALQSGETFHAQDQYVQIQKQAFSSQRSLPWLRILCSQNCLKQETRGKLRRLLTASKWLRTEAAAGH